MLTFSEVIIVPKADGSVIIDTRLDTTGLSKGVGNLKSQFGGLSSITKKLGGVIAAAFSVKVIADFSKEAIKLGSDLQEVQNVVDVTFTTMNEQVNKFAKSAMQTAGLSETMAKRYAGTFGAMAKSFKFSEEDAYAMATSLTQLSGDVASFYNLTQDAAYTKLKSVFTGETETLKDLGVVMTQTALDDFALRKGLSKTTSQMSEQEKVALRYQFVMEQLSSASGDFVRTQDGWANQMRILSLQFEQLKATVGMGLINVLAPALKMLNELISKFQALADKFRDFTTALFGNASGSADGVAEKYAAAAQGADDLAENTEKAGKAAKRSLAGFDELNILSNDKKESAGTTGPTTGISTNVSIGEVTVTNDATNGLVIAVDKVIAKIKELIQPLTKINLTPAKKAFDKLGKSLKDLGKTIAAGLEWAWFNVLVPLAKWTIEKAVPKLVSALSDAFRILSGVLKPLGKLLGPVVKALGELAMLLVDAVLSGLGSALNWLADTINPIAEDAYILSDAEKELARQAEAAAEAFREMQAATEEQEDSINAEMDRITMLWEEMDKLVDAEGRVQESDKARVEYILGELNEALGTEYTMVGNIIQNYQSLRGEIEKVIAAKRANLLLDAHADDYTAAVKEQEKSWEAVLIAQKAYDAQLKQFREAEEKHKKGLIATKAFEAEGQLFNEKSYALRDAKKAWADYTATIKEYEEAQRLILEGNYEAATKLLVGQNTAYEQHADTVESETGRVKAALEQELAEAKSLAEQARLGFAMGIVGFGQEMVDETEKAVREAEKKLFAFLQNKPYGTGTIGIGVAPVLSQFGYTGMRLPHLAQGTVIPPNAPFMAVLGDQRHGTNIEAPLSTIQEAVAEVMADYEASNLAGHEATVEVLRQLLSAVLNIEVGDTVIGQAANRFNRRMAITTGGV